MGWGGGGERRGGVRRRGGEGRREGGRESSEQEKPKQRARKSSRSVPKPKMYEKEKSVGERDREKREDFHVSLLSLFVCFCWMETRCVNGKREENVAPPPSPYIHTEKCYRHKLDGITRNDRRQVCRGGAR